MRLAAVQFRPRRAGRSALERLVPLARAAAQGSDLVVLPEAAVSGYWFRDRAAAERVAEPEDGPTARRLGEVARSTGSWLVGGFVESRGNDLHNAAWILAPTGERYRTYRKRLLFEADFPWATPGTEEPPRVDADWGSFQVGICMDLNDDAFVRVIHRDRPAVVAFPTCWMEEGAPIWPYWAQRLRGTGAALVAADAWGQEGPLRYAGRSAILDAAGRARAGARRWGDRVLRARLLPSGRS